MSSKTRVLGYSLALVLTLSLVLTVGITLKFCGRPTARTNQIVEKNPIQSLDGIWTRATDEKIPLQESVVRVTPKSFGLFKLDPTTLDNALRKVHPEFSVAARNDPVVITLPLPTGSYARFRVEESSVMEPELAKRYPQIKSYKGKSLDDPTAIVRFERTPDGLHVMGLSASGAFLIDGVGKKGANTYATYFKTSLPANPNPVACRAKPDDPESSAQTDKPSAQVRKTSTKPGKARVLGSRPWPQSPNQSPQGPKPNLQGPTPSPPDPKAWPTPSPSQRETRRMLNHASLALAAQDNPIATSDETPAAGDNNLRVYRIAVAASHRYVAAIHELNNPTAGDSSDPVEEALEAIHRTIDRVNLIYEAELGVRFVLVNDETKIIFASAADDPYDDEASPDGPHGLLRINQRILDQRILPANYDIGHLFIVPLKPFGVSDEPCACNDFFKGEGLSGSPTPAGNVFDVQFVAHEIGHQLGASHSFNGSTKGCRFRNGKTAYEPGSGSTIMGYSSATNICGEETIQSTADPYFHAISLQEIKSYITSGEGDSCPRKIASGNNFSPVVDAGAPFNIPQGTPFTLTVAGSSDGDGDPLTFSWEEFDLGPRDPPHPSNPADRTKKRPIFRSFAGGTSLTRTFPALRHLLNPPANYVAEALPGSKRIMTFRVTARDGRGRYGFDDVLITVISKRGSATVGPFVVTQPQGGSVWPRGSTQTVVWSVANTQLLPIGCERVKISLLIDGDDAHPIVLAADVPNNGAATITLPAEVPLTTAARIKVEAINNIFFGISDGDIRMTQ